MLVEAANEDAAIKKAEKYGRLEAVDGETLTVDDQPAETIFAGVEKLSEVCHTGENSAIASGDEVIFNEFQSSRMKNRPKYQSAAKR